MHRVHCEVALLKLLRQKMRRKTKTCYCVRNIRNALVRHKQSVQSRRLRAWQAFLEFPEAPKIFSGGQILAGF